MYLVNIFINNYNIKNYEALFRLKCLNSCCTSSIVFFDTNLKKYLRILLFIIFKKFLEKKEKTVWKNICQCILLTSFKPLTKQFVNYRKVDKWTLFSGERRNFWYISTSFEKNENQHILMISVFIIVSYWISWFC